MKKTIIIISLLLPIWAFSQTHSLTHSIDLNLGAADRYDMFGTNLRCQYALGVCPYLDVLAAAQISTGSTASNTLNTDASYHNEGLSIGLRGYIDFLKICSFKISCLTGVNVDCQQGLLGNYYGLFTEWRGNLDGKAELDFQVSPIVSLGLFYNYSMIYQYQKNADPNLSRDIQTFGLNIGFKLK